MHKRAIVTGASRGIGRAIATRLERDGWAVLNFDRLEPENSGGAPGRWFGVDLADPAQLERALRSVLAEAPVLGLVNNAAIARAALVEDTTLEDFDLSVAVNMRAPMLCMRALAPVMRAHRFGRVVNVSSRAHLGKTHRSSYAGTKGGILSMGRVWALELAGAGVTCNTVAPGPVRTEMFERVNPPGMARTRAIVEQIPVGRMGEPDDIANAVAFFMNEGSGFVTGQTLYVCGGVTLARGGS